MRGKSLYNCRFLNPTPDLLNQNVLVWVPWNLPLKKICLEEFNFKNLFPMCVSFFSVEVKRTKSSQCRHFFNYCLTGKTISMRECLNFFQTNQKNNFMKN